MGHVHGHGNFRICNPQRSHGLQPTRLLHPWDFPGKSTGVGCHCLLRLKHAIPCFSSGKTVASDIGIIGRSPVFRGDPDHLAQYTHCSRPRDSSGFMAASHLSMTEQLRRKISISLQPDSCNRAILKATLRHNIPKQNAPI